MNKGLIRTPDWKEMRRFRALELKRHGWTHAEVAEALGVTKMAVSKWMKAVHEGGEAALHSRPHKGAAPQLSKADLALLPEFLVRGAEAFGFCGEVWTCARVACVIEWAFGVSYHKGHVWRLLKGLEWTPQKPAVNDRRRNEREIAHWRAEVWPDLKKRRGVSAALLSA
jgi:transposase